MKLAITPLPSGLHYNIPSAHYHDPRITATPALTASMADKVANEGPARAWIWRRNQVRKRDEDTTEAKRQQLEFGCAAHVAMLEPELLVEKVVLIEAEDYKGKDAKALRDEAREEGKFPLLYSFYAKLDAMGQAMRNELPGVNFQTASDLAQGVFDGGRGEVTLIAEKSGIWLKARPDYVRVSSDEHMIVDYKVTGLRGDRMEAEARRRNWPERTAFYQLVYRELFGVTPRYLYVVQEHTDPYFAYAWEVPSIGVKEGELEVMEAMRIYKQCMEENYWPSDVEGVRYLFDEGDAGEISE